MTGVWEIRVFGRQGGRIVRKTYTFVRFDYHAASREAKRLALLDGIESPAVYAATRLREVPVSPVPATEPPSSASEPPSSGVSIALKSR